ncbi:MAG: class I SAM-dependent methyltransferase [Eubacteriales bacterium]|nr:class I SAM-dependent methyltransferase [Eubacteriales bacterium]
MQDTYGLDNRLLEIASMVRKDKVFADIGTDHGYIPVYLLGNKICSKGYACDINELPLKKAENNIKGYGFDKNIKTILCDGLNALHGGVEDIIIAGMGGDTIIHILDEADWIRNENTHLILQPMTKVEKLREYLYEDGFEIREEKAVSSGKFVYTVMSVFYTGKKQKISQVFYYTGKLLEASDDEAIKYINRVIKILKAKAKGQSSSEKEKDNAEETLKTIKTLEDVVGIIEGKEM